MLILVMLLRLTSCSGARPSLLEHLLYAVLGKVRELTLAERPEPESVSCDSGGEPLRDGCWSVTMVTELSCVSMAATE